MSIVFTDFYHTAAGTLAVNYTELGIVEAYFTSEVPRSYSSLSVKDIVMSNTIITQGTPFQRRVWQAVLQIPEGATVSYQDIAHSLEMPKACRAIANAIGQNKIAYVIPCHRVIRKDGALGGYRWGIALKRLLLEAEGIFL